MLQLCSNNLLYKERMLMSVHGNNLSTASQNSAPYQHTVLTYGRGIFLTFVLALASLQLARLPYLSIVGALVLAILLGMSWRASLGIPAGAQAGITFTTKRLLKAGIILMGLRLNLHDIWASGLNVIAIDAFVIVFTLIVMYAIGQRMKLPEQLTLLTAVGTAVCGASAILAVAPLIRAKEDVTALAVSFIALTGTVGALAYSFLYPLLPYDPAVYGVLTGATLHELGHVIAAGAAGGTSSSEMAVLVKLGRVALLIPVALAIGTLYNKRHRWEREQSQSASRLANLPVPWFIVGFLAMSALNTLDWLPAYAINGLLSLSGLLLAMAMVGVGLGVSFQAFRDNGRKGMMACAIGSSALVLFGVLLVQWFY